MSKDTLKKNLNQLTKDDLWKCVEDISIKKGQTIEDFIMATLAGKMGKVPNLGTKGKVVYPKPGEKFGILLGQNYTKDNGTINEPIGASDDMNIKIKYNIPNPPVGWWMSEKFDGYRGLWDGEKFLFRSGKEYFYVPMWFKALMPPGIALDGELFLSRVQFQQLGFLKSKYKPGRVMDLDKKWSNITYHVFDAPSIKGTFEHRMKELEKIISSRCKIWPSIPIPPYLERTECPLIVTEQIKVESPEHLAETYKKLVSEKAEGVMLRAPNSPYIPWKTRMMLKLKPRPDAECIIRGYNPGEGKYSKMLGSFKCEMLEEGRPIGKFFNMGGVSDEIRKNYAETHPVGTIVTYKYFSLTDQGVPRMPTYKTIRYAVDMSPPSVIEQITPDQLKKNMISAFQLLIREQKTTRPDTNWGFRVGTYEDVIDVLRGNPPIKNIDEVDDFLKSHGWKDPKKITAKMKEIIATGSLASAERARADPKQAIIMELMSIPEVGQSLATTLYDQYNIRSISDLQNMTRIFEERGQQTPLNPKQLIGLKYYYGIIDPETFEDVQIPREEITKYGKLIQSVIISLGLDAGVDIVGSYRRGRDSSGDIDILINSSLPGKNSFKPVIQELQRLNIIKETLVAGPNRFRGISQLPGEAPRRIDISYTSDTEYPFALMHSSSGRKFNQKFRAMVKKKGYSLNEHGITKNKIKVSETEIMRKIGKPQIESEKDIFNFFEADYVPPQRR